MQNNPSRLVLVDAIRSLGVLMVLAIHLGFFREMLGIPERTAWIPFGIMGGYGVSFFFVVSGFLITRVLVEPSRDLKIISLRQFYVHRIGRIWPLLLLTCLLGACIMQWRIGPLRALSVCFSAPRHLAGFWVSIAAFVFNWFRIFTETPTHQYGFHWGVLWSLSVEEQYYLIYPLLLIGLKSVRAVVIFLCGVILGGLVWRAGSYLYQPDNYVLSITASFGAFDQIAVGCLLFFAQRRISHSRPVPRGMAIAMAATGIMLAFLVLARVDLYTPMHRVYGPSLLALGVFLALLGGLQLPVAWSAFARALCLPGRLSYGIYLLHPVVMYFCTRFLLGKNPIAAYGIFVLLNVAVASVVFRFFEGPANRAIRSRFP